MKDDLMFNDKGEVDGLEGYVIGKATEVFGDFVKEFIFLKEFLMFLILTALS